MRRILRSLTGDASESHGGSQDIHNRPFNVHLQCMSDILLVEGLSRVLQNGVQSMCVSTNSADSLMEQSGSKPCWFVKIGKPAAALHPERACLDDIWLYWNPQDSRVSPDV